MATVLKRKQSSLDSFYLPHRIAAAATITVSTASPAKACAAAVSPTTNTTAAATITKTAAATSITTDSASDYERMRQENIRRNQDFFQKLGINSTLNQLPFKPIAKPKTKSKPKPSTPHTPSPPLRRSTRKRPSKSPLEEEEEVKNTAKDPRITTPDYDDSSVLKYTCNSAHNLQNPLLPSPVPPSSCFRIVGKPLLDPSLTRIYTIDVCYLKSGENRALIAAGGHGGYISIYGSSLSFDDEVDGGNVGTEGPLMGWKSSRSWVSGVGFMRKNPMLLVSSSNDGGVVIWDIAKQPSVVSPSSRVSSPPVVVESRDLHLKGIFSMDLFNEFIATASKDSSLGICRLTEEGELVAERRVSGHHSGAIKGVSFRDAHTLADCGADGSICIIDTRIPKSCILSIESEYSSGVNSVQWCPSNEFLLLSASKEPSLLLYDIRNSAQALHRLEGHVHARSCYQIYKPAFVDNGAVVATPGQGSRSISLYSADTGTVRSRGLIGYDANMVLCTSGDLGEQRVWAAAKQVNQICLT